MKTFYFVSLFFYLIICQCTSKEEHIFGDVLLGCVCRFYFFFWSGGVDFYFCLVFSFYEAPYSTFITFIILALEECKLWELYKGEDSKANCEQMC